MNLEKSYIVVFRNGGYLKGTEKWIYNGEHLKSVSYCKYLGIIFSSRLVWTKACETLSIQAKKASFPVIEILRKFPSITLTTALKIFDTKIAPILLYGSEIWGYKYCDSVEKIQCFFIKNIYVSVKIYLAMLY